MVCSPRYSLTSIKFINVHNVFHMFQPSLKEQKHLELGRKNRWSKVFQDIKRFAITCTIYIIYNNTTIICINNLCSRFVVNRNVSKTDQCYSYNLSQS